MLRHIETAALVAVLPISSAIAATPVSFDELTKHPQHYNGRIVELTAWLQVDTADKIASLQKAISGADKPNLDASKRAKKLKGSAEYVEKSAASTKSPSDAARMHALADILKHPAA